MKKKINLPLDTRFDLRSFAVICASVLFFAEFIFVTLRFQSKNLLNLPDLSPWQRDFGHLGDVARASVLALLLYIFIRKKVVYSGWTRLVADLSYPRLARILPVQLLSYGVFVYFSHLVFDVTHLTHTISVWVAIGWMVSGLTVVALWILSLTTASALKRFFLSEWRYFLLILPITLGAWIFSLGSQSSWTLLADKTFDVSAWMLGIYGKELIYVDPATKILGLGNFVVSIAPQCSGYEGIGLIIAFTSLYLVMNSKELRFPLTLLLFPLGMACIWLLNCLRIAVLISLGYFWSPEVAVGGFHSQAGWITFILTSVLLLWTVDNSRLFTKPGLTKAPAASGRSLGLAVSTLVPLVVLLAATLLTSAIASDFDYAYPLRVLLVAVALYRIWPHLQLPTYRPRWDAALAAVAVAAAWAGLLGIDAAYNAIFQNRLDAMPGHWAFLWLAIRFMGAVVTVPIAEELAFRAYLLCRLSDSEVTTSGQLPARILGIAVSSVAFGALHNAWLAGTLAGFIYALVRLRSMHIADAIVAHAGTNALLFMLAAYFGWWNLL